MNYKTMLKGTLAFSLSLMVGSAMASTTTTSDTQAYEETFETATVDASISTLAATDSVTGDPCGWLAPENDESKIIAGGPTGSTKALQLNTDAGTLTNLFDSAVATDLNGGIAAAGAYFETEVKFVPSDTLDAGITGGQDATKFAIYAYANENASPVTTNLVVFHAYYDADNAANNYTSYTNEIFNVAIDASVYTKLRVEMKKLEIDEGTYQNVFSVAINDAAPLTSSLALDKALDPTAAGIWFQTVELTDSDSNKLVSSLNFKGTGEIDNIKAGVITETTTYAIDWTGSQNVVVSNNNAQLTVADTNFLAGAVLTFYPTEGSITNVNGVAQDPALESYDYTVGSADAIVTVLAGEEATPPAPTEFAAGDDVDGIITADQATWLNGYIGTYTYEELAALTGWQNKYLLNVDPVTGSGTLTVTAITVGTDVQVTVALARTEGETAVTGKAINGTLKLYGTADLGTDFAELASATITDDDFSESNTTTATFTGTGAIFFKAVIE